MGNGIEVLRRQQNKDKADLAEANRKMKEMQSMRAAEIKRGPGYEAVASNKFEREAGVEAPGFEGVRDIKTGQLLDQYKLDPFAGEASQRLRQEALGTGPSEWAKNALGKQQFEEANQMGNVGRQQQMAQSQAQSQLMRQGGLGGGSRTSLARSGMRDQLMAAQGVASAGQLARFGISDTDAKRRQGLLGTNADAERQAQMANIGTQKEALSAKAQFDANRYAKQMEAWAAKQGADATRAAGSGGGGGKK